MGSVETIANLTKAHKQKGDSVGMITGNFDILTVGHIRLFKFAKTHTDILIVGVDCPKIANTYRRKEARLINPLEFRLEILESIKSIDYVFPIDTSECVTTLEELNNFQTDLLKNISPTHVITNPLADLFINERRARCLKLNIKLLEHWEPIIPKQAY